MSDKLISEPIRPMPGTMDARAMARGEPGLPRRFIWRGREREVAEVLETWKETGRCTSGSDEQYVRKHWYRVRTADGAEMKIYFERQARSQRERTRRWWLHSMSGSEDANE